tara:strand:- start:325 stop:921 length:597 start_codon:yes stop_codon:yes gene_type:complete
MNNNNDFHKTRLTTDNISVVKNMSSLLSSRKRNIPLFSKYSSKKQKKDRVICTFNTTKTNDDISYSAGNYPDFHQLYHEYIENLRAKGSPIPFHCPKATQIANKLSIITKKELYIPKCGKNCVVRKQCLDNAMKNYFHTRLKQKLKSTDLNERNILFFIKSLDKIDKSDNEHYYPSCCRGNYLNECSKCLFVNIKYDN